MQHLWVLWSLTFFHCTCYVALTFYKKKNCKVFMFFQRVCIKFISILSFLYIFTQQTVSYCLDTFKMSTVNCLVLNLLLNIAIIANLFSNTSNESQCNIKSATFFQKHDAIIAFHFHTAMICTKINHNLFLAVAVFSWAKVYPALFISLPILLQTEHYPLVFRSCIFLSCVASSLIWLWQCCALIKFVYLP